MIELTPAQRRALRARAHSLHPVVSISQHGLSEAVQAEIDRSLKAHELIKVRVYGAERDDRESLLAEICDRLQAAPVQHIGNILVVFRENPAEPKPAPAAKPARKARPKATPPAKPAAPRRRLGK
ncbi:MAG: YhbY family RNA-binding protein [Rhodocyclales bacterium]|nr:YhbY family RNA-binding protein [Rhodocyclales bacterium]